MPPDGAAATTEPVGEDAPGPAEDEAQAGVAEVAEVTEVPKGDGVAEVTKGDGVAEVTKVDGVAEVAEVDGVAEVTEATDASEVTEVAGVPASTNGDGAPAASEHEVRAARWSVAEIRNIKVDLPAPHAVVVLREVVAPFRKLAIPVGLPDATGMTHAWRSIATPRPLTHELFSDVVQRLGATIEVVRLTGRRAGVVLAELELSSPRGREVVPCRPSDGLTLALRQGVAPPIMVDRRLFRGPGDVEPRP